MNTVSTEQALNKAYRLAYFLHQDKDVAMQILGAATLKLNVAMAVQSKRLYYVPVGRFSPGESRRTDGIRNKALFSDLHLLQRLVYVESEPYERQKERAVHVTPPDVPAAGDSASDEDLLVFFIKHLVRITTKRNAFYVTLGVSRLLHSYSTLETMELYNAVIGEPERVKDDYYYRSRKAVLMHEMYQRFGQLIRASRQRRGEERFETQQGSSEQRSLVKECLRLFTPWDTKCPVPADFNPLKSVIASLTSKSSVEENRVEISRIHAILHPNCFEKLVAAFGYGPPADRMELPRFFTHEDEDDQSPPQPRSAPADLTAEELAEINDMLAEQARRRRRSSSAGVIRVMVDGIERGRLNPAEQSSISFSAGEDAELIEVKLTDSSGDLLLATHLLTSFGKNEHDAPIVSSIRLEGGQKLSLSITRGSIDGGGDLQIKFGYQEASLRGAVRLWWQRLNLRRSAEQDRSLWGAAGMSTRYVLAGSMVVVICLTGYLGYVALSSLQTSEPPQISSVQPAPVNQDLIQDLKAPTPAPIASQPPRRARNNRSTTAKTPATKEVADDVTRSSVAVANLGLREVKKIYVDIRGGAAVDQLRSNLVESLSASGLVAATTDMNEADSSLKITASQTGIENAQQIVVSAQLVNARGTMLWPAMGRSARRYSGETSKVVSEILRDLLAEIRSARAGN
ncbi:MAG TPA: hypothetical protein VJT15_09480 [Pyrinomonadaceae bacterium]|nr:hypothetical protein [Pyrinomonadaceae bacterium]